MSFSLTFATLYDIEVYMISVFIFPQGSRDNMSVVLICLPGAPKVSPESVKREAELDKYLEARVEGRTGIIF